MSGSGSRGGRSQGPPPYSLENVAPELVRRERLAPRALPVQKRARQTVLHILDCAAALVDEAGIEGFNTNLLAQRAGVRVRTVYRYYPSKLAILTELVFRLNDRLNEYAGPISMLADPGRDWREIFGLWIDRLLDFLREVPGARLMVGAARGYPELVELQNRMYDRQAQELEDALRGRGLELPAAQMRALCRAVPEVFDTLALLTHASEGDAADALRAEMKRWILGYLAQYLD
ncbi:MAG TPA: TetR/AcrR family transcriptional regulator [Myxococcota bacterium]